MDQIRRFAAAKKARGNAEPDGYVAWVRPLHFVRLRAPTAAGNASCAAPAASDLLPFPDR